VKIRIPSIICLAAFLLFLPLKAFSALPIGPEQPKFGPGGSSYPHADFVKKSYGYFEERFYIFEPAMPTPASAPVAVFLHGWFAANPDYYIGWIEHLCKRGWIVIFPCYQGTGSHASVYTLNTIRSIKEAFKVLYSSSPIAPDRDRVSVIGHEAGAIIGANVAASSRYFKIPVPKAVMVLMPLGGLVQGGYLGMEMYDLSAIREGTLLMVVVGEEDLAQSENIAREIFYSADNVRTTDKTYITLLSDVRGTPALFADRFAPFAPKENIYEREIENRRFEFIHMFKHKGTARPLKCRGIDAMDWLGTFRLFDALADTAFSGGDRSQVFGNTENQRFMGYWSNGAPVKGFYTTDRP